MQKNTIRPNDTELTTITIRDHSSEAVYRERVEGENEMAITVSNTGASSDYLKRVAHRLDGHLNCVEFKECIMLDDDLWSFHRAGEAPAAIMVPALAERSSSINMKDPYNNNSMPAKLTIPQGQTIVSKPSENALQITMELDRFDTEVDGTVCEAHLQKEVQTIVTQLDYHVTASLVKELTNNPSNAKYLRKTTLDLTQGMTSAERVELLQDAIDDTVEKGRMFGAHVSDWVIGLDSKSFRDVERLAKRAGLLSVEDFLGTQVVQFIGANTVTTDKDGKETPPANMLMAPKRHILCSFRERADGMVFDCIATRKPATQSTNLKIVATADLLIAGFTQAKASTGEIVEVTVPLVSVFLSKAVVTPPTPAKK